jgi:molybdopterin-synthase adenylyltransferase
MLNQNQQQRYLRNIILPEIGEKGQEKLLKARVLVVGAGGLGSPILLYLSACGVGNIGVVDFDEVELSNLQRQIIHNFNDLQKAKVLSAKEKINKLNSDVNLEIFNQKATLQNLEKIAKNYDFIVDATDNFPTRFMINEFCFKAKKPLIFGAVKGFLGQVSVFKAYDKTSPCYACFNENIVGDEFSLPLLEKGILGAVAGSVGAIQATTIVKEILGIGESLVGKLLIFDFLQNNFRKSILKKNIHCKVCK